MKTLAAYPGNYGRHGHRAVLVPIIVVAVLWPYMFSLADSETSFTVANQTAYFLHVSVNNERFVYVAPGRAVSVGINVPATVYAHVRYSPGQDVRGIADTTVLINQTINSSKARSDVSTCSTNDKGGSTCQSSSEPNSSSVTIVFPVRWDVVPSDFSPE